MMVCLEMVERADGKEDVDIMVEAELEEEAVVIVDVVTTMVE